MSGETDPLEGARWETVGWIQVDTATVGIGDGSVADADPGALLEAMRSVDPDSTAADLTSLGYPLITLGTSEDAPYPVEVSAEIPAARVELTNDVAEVHGKWTVVGEVEITTGKLLVADPLIPDDAARVLLAWANGRYTVEVFQLLDERDRVEDHLGIRVRPRAP